MAAPEGYFTRDALRDKVGLTEAQIRSLTARDVIVADGTNASGYALYKKATVERLLEMKTDGSLFRHLSEEGVPTAEALSTLIARYPAEDGVRVFELLREGKTLEEIILATRIHPLVVKCIAADYDDITGSIHLPKRVVDQMNALGVAGKLLGAFPLRDADNVYEVVELSAQERTCETCGTEAAINRCMTCLVNARRAALAAARAAEPSAAAAPHSTPTGPLTDR